MQAYLGNQDVTLTIPLTDNAGEVIDATAVQYRVTNQDEVELVAKTTLATFNSGDADVVVTIPALQNDLGIASRALRVVELYVTSAAGVTLISTEYVLEASSVLAVGVNSFQTYSAAVLVGYELPNLPGWNAAGKTDRINALMAAYRSFSRLCLRYIAEDEDAQSRVIQPAEWNYNDVTKLDSTQLASLSVEYIGAIRRAQLLEADYLLGGDEVDELRKAGIMSATVGESSQFFRTVKPYEGVLCKRALKELSRYMISSMRVGRA